MVLNQINLKVVDRVIPIRNYSNFIGAN